MPTTRPNSARVLEKALAQAGGALTVADAAARSGLPLREAEEGLRYLAAEFSGHLAATDKGELLYSFPRGLTRPPEKLWWRRALRTVGRGIAGVGRFIVRAWVSVVLIGYALAFLALLIALAFRGDSKDDGPGDSLGLVLRVIGEALFWTFHPFSPVAFHYQPNARGRLDRGRDRNRDKTPFYEKVNRFVFGPRPPAQDPLEDERNVLAELRRQAGRVTPADVMRVTGLPRERAEALLLRLLVDYQGELEVTDSGAIVYRFSNLRATAQAGHLPDPPAFWNSTSVLLPLTGNTGGSNFLFGAINAFNLAASTYVLAGGWTIERIGQALAQMNERHPLPLPPPEGIPLVLGAIPFVFSAALFALPLFRLLRRPAETRRVARENGWRGVLRLAVTGRRGSVVQTKAEMESAWLATSGVTPTESELTDAVRAAGGEVDVGEDGQVIYKFDLLEGELRAAEDMRRAASSDEANAGRVVFDSADEGAGIRDEVAPGRPEGRPETDRPKPPIALPEAREVFPESQEDLLNRIGVDTRRRGR